MMKDIVSYEDFDRPGTLREALGDPLREAQGGPLRGDTGALSREPVPRLRLDQGAALGYLRW
jgi:hypothetical protein